MLHPDFISFSIFHIREVHLSYLHVAFTVILTYNIIIYSSSDRFSLFDDIYIYICSLENSKKDAYCSLDVKIHVSGSMGKCTLCHTILHWILHMDSIVINVDVAQSDDLEQQCEDAVFELCDARERFPLQCAKELEASIRLANEICVSIHCLELLVNKFYIYSLSIHLFCR